MLVPLEVFSSISETGLPFLLQHFTSLLDLLANLLATSLSREL